MISEVSVDLKQGLHGE